MQSLTARELALDREPLTIEPTLKPVLVWIHFYAEAIRVKAWAWRLTSKAVGVRFYSGGKEYATWVWSDAVDPDPEPRPDAEA